MIYCLGSELWYELESIRKNNSLHNTVRVPVVHYWHTCSTVEIRVIVETCSNTLVESFTR